MAKSAILVLGAVIISNTSILPSPSSADDLPVGSIITVAGDTLQGYNGDQIEAAAATLNLPMGVVVGRGGLAVYISDAGNHRIRMVDLEYGDIFTVAGNGSGDFRGDGELATNASLKTPAGIVVDREGILYIADRGNHRIRRVDREGVISTVAGGTKPGFSGDGGGATQASLKDPVDVVIDDLGNLYIADLGNSRIRRVDGETGIISTLAGNGERRSDKNDDVVLALESALSPSGIALDGSGGLIVADMRNHRIRRVDLDSGLISTVAGTGKRGFLGDGEPAMGARFNNPSWVTVSAINDLYISDAGNNRIRKVDALTDIVTTIAGNDQTGYRGDLEAAVNASLWSPYGLALDRADNVYVADYLNHRVRRINLRKNKTIDFKKRDTTSWLDRALWAGIPTGLGVSAWIFLMPNSESKLPQPPNFPAK